MEEGFCSYDKFANMRDGTTYCTPADPRLANAMQPHEDHQLFPSNFFCEIKTAIRQSPLHSCITILKSPVYDSGNTI